MDEVEQVQQDEPKPEPKQIKAEFSKIILGAVMLTYFAGVVIGGFIVWKEPMQLGPFLAYIGGPTGIAIGAYAWKAKAENMVKLGFPPPPDNQYGGFGGYEMSSFGMYGGDDRWKYGSF